MSLRVFRDRFLLRVLLVGLLAFVLWAVGFVLIVRGGFRETLEVSDGFASQTYVYLAVFTVTVFAGFVGVCAWLYRKHVYGPMEALALSMEARIADLQDKDEWRGGGRDLASVLVERYGELIALVDGQDAEMERHGDELRQLLDTLPSFVWYKDDKNNILRVNRAGAESVGRSIEELEGRSCEDFFPKAEAEAFFQDDLKVIESGQPKLGYLESYTPMGGRPRTIRTDKLPYFDANGKVTGVVALVTDVTELLSLKEESRSVERLMKRFVEIGNWDATDVDERILAALRETCQALGMKTAILSEIEGESYRIKLAYDERELFAAGDCCRLDEVYCSILVNTGRSMASTHMGASAWKDLPCYRNLKLESYIAAPIRLEGKIVGSINLSSPLRRDKPFSSIEVDSVRMLARWVEGLLRRESYLNQLTVQREELRLILDTTPSYIWFKDDRNNILRVNKAAAESVAMTVSELEGRPASEVFPEDSDRFYEDDLAVLKSGKPRLGYVQSYTPKDGSQRWTRTDKLPYKLPGGRRGVLAVVTDITELLESQNALRDSEERFQLAANGASVGIWDWFDVGGAREWWSPKVYELLGYEVGEIEATIGTFEKLLHPDDVKPTFEHVERCLETGGAYACDYRLRCKNGDYRWFLGSGMISTGAEGKVRRMTGTIQDIHDRKVAEEELFVAVNELKRANKELSDFAFLSSHDLQEPLRTITSFVQLLRDGYGQQLDGEANEYIAFIQTGVTRMQNMIRGLLRYSKLDTRQEAFGGFGLREAIDIAVGDLGGRIEESNTRLVVREPFPRVRGDLNQVSLVFQNLISNAIKFNRSERPLVEIEAVAGDSLPEGLEGVEGGQHCVVRVKDNGIGIRKAYHEKIFSIFQKLHPADEYEGSGIGLSTVQKIVLNHGGKVWLESEEGKGTCFFVALPLEI